MSLTEEAWARNPILGSVRGWPVRHAVPASIFVALVLGAFLTGRRLSGSASLPLPAWQLVAAATLLSGWALTVRASSASRLIAWLAATALLLFAVGCSFPGERSLDWLVWLTVMGVYLSSASVIGERPAKRTARPRDADRLLQQLTRARTSDGHDVAHGVLHAEFAKGERSTMLYVAFCPPFERLPQLELESDVDAKVVQALHHGAQIEVRLPHAAANPTLATVEFFASDAE